MAHFSSAVRRRRTRYRAESAAVSNAARGLFPGASPTAQIPIAGQKRNADIRSVPSDESSRELPDGQEPENAARSLMERELERAKEAAEAANEAKTRYLVAVSHEIRAPLNAIYGYAQLLERGGAVSPAEAGGVIKRSAEHLTNLIEGILEISRIEGGVLEVRNEVVEFPTLIAHVMDMFRMQAQAKGIELVYEAQGRVPRFVRTDEKRLSQILINLLSNAIKYTRAGRVTVAVTYRSQVAEVVISDTGIGIAPKDLQLIFEPFERGSSPEAALQPGIGLGLAITRALSRILGGEIVATSTPGVGSSFKLSLFLPEPFAAPIDAGDYRQVSGYQGPRRTVLVIDDQLSQVNILDSLLRELDFVVYAASNGAEGLALAARCRPDIVLLDIEMPGTSGWEVAAQLRATYGDAMRIVMVSANGQDAHGSGEDAATHDGYVAKPVDQKKLLATIGGELQLSWDYVGEPSPPAAADTLQPPTLPREAAESLRRIRQFAEVGHIRAIEAAIDQLAADVPGSAPAVAMMRDYVGNFDLRALMTMLDGHQSN